MSSVAIAPNRMPEGPAYAVQKALKAAGLGLDDIAAIEINEAFAAVPLVSTLMLGRQGSGQDQGHPSQDQPERQRHRGGAPQHGQRGAADHETSCTRCAAGAAATPWAPSAAAWPRPMPASSRLLEGVSPEGIGTRNDTASENSRGVGRGNDGCGDSALLRPSRL